LDGGTQPLTERLSYREPLDSDALLSFFALRAVRGVEEVGERRYRRSLRLGHGAGVAELEPGDGHFTASYWLENHDDLDEAVARSRRLLDLDADPEPVLETLGRDPLLGPLVRATPGLRVPRHVDPHELAVRAVLGQQVSLAGAATVAGRLVADHGEPLSQPRGTVTHLFPSPERLAEVDPQRLPMPRSRARALQGLVDAIANGELALEAAGDRDRAVSRLLELPGIGPWTAGYIAMRGLGDSDVFLAADLGVRRALERLGTDGRPGPAARLAEHWRPYRAYAFQHLLATMST
jgi:AraC family transcriptional regulator of adaptative response / DNA-3-methyladenine glycosylase II